MPPDKECAKYKKEIKKLQNEIKRLSKIEPEIKNGEKLYMKSKFLNSSENIKFMDYHITPNKDKETDAERISKHGRPTVHKEIKPFLKWFVTSSLKLS